MFRSAESFADAYSQRFAQSNTIDLQAGADRTDPDFGGEPVTNIHAASVLSFNGAGKLQTVLALSHFLVGGETVLAGTVLELPDIEAKRMGPDGTGQVRPATDDEIAAAQKATKAK